MTSLGLFLIFSGLVMLVIGLANALVLCLWRTWRWMHDVRADAAMTQPPGPRPPRPPRVCLPVDRPPTEAAMRGSLQDWRRIMGEQRR